MSALEAPIRVGVEGCGPSPWCDIIAAMEHDTFDAWQRHIGTDTRSGSFRHPDPQEIAVPVLTILYHPVPGRVGERAPLPWLAEGQAAGISRLEPGFAPTEGGARRPLADPLLSRQPIRILPCPEGFVLDTSATTTRITVDGYAPGESVKIDRTALWRGLVLGLNQHVVLLLHLLPPVIHRPPGFGLIGESAALLELRREIAQVADLDIPVLLLGESGTGKELVAKAIRQNGPRRDQPFLSINVGAVAPSLAAAALFGTVKGAYSGADRNRRGYFQRADGGTLFLDEIGEAGPELQVPLLRSLESGEIQPVGAETPLRVDVRVISATDADLEQAVARGDFKAPLLHRLDGFKITLPPLRERRDDVGRLFFHFLREELRQLGEEERLRTPDPYARPWVPASLVERLAVYDWPGNVRQLRNVARQLAVANRGQPEVRVSAGLEALLAGAEAPPPAAGRTGTPPPPAQRRPGRRPAAAYRDPGDVGEEELIAVLGRNRWNVKPAAEQLGVSRASLYHLIERCPRLRKAADLGRDEIEACFERSGRRVDAAAEELEVSQQGLKIRMRELGLR